MLNFSTAICLLTLIITACQTQKKERITQKEEKIKKSQVYLHFTKRKEEISKAKKIPYNFHHCGK